MDLTMYLPKWTKRVVIDTGGRDPLGLSRVAFNLTDYLLTGIVTITNRARYYSFYTWALWHIEKEEKPENYNQFAEAFRRREAAMGLATLSCNPTLLPIGVVELRDQLDRGKQIGEYACNVKVLPSSNLGGYSQNYSSSIYHLKLSSGDENFIDRVYGTGVELAAAFHETVQGTRYIRNKIFLENSISDKDLRELTRCFTLDSIGEDFAAKEREKLIEIFFNLDESTLDGASALRRQTLTLLMHAAAEYKKQGVKLDSRNYYSLDEYLLFAFYYGVLWVENETVRTFQKLDEFKYCYDLWTQFCLHQFLTQALEYLLYAVLEVIGTETTGLTLPETIKRILQPEFFGALKNQVGTDCSTPNKLLLALGIEQIPTEATSNALQKELSPAKSLSEAHIMWLDHRAVETATAKAVLLLSVLYGKWRGMFQDPATKMVEQNAGAQLWAKPVLYRLDNWLTEDLTWSEALTGIIEEFVLNQHDRIMYEKGKIDGWLRRLEGRIVKDQDYEPNWRASRFLNAVRILADLKLLEIDEKKELSITVDGQALLKRLIK
jgi:hypothetical protein